MDNKVPKNNWPIAIVEKFDPGIDGKAQIEDVSINAEI